MTMQGKIDDMASASCHGTIGEVNPLQQPSEESLEDDFTVQETNTESSQLSILSIPSSKDESNGLVDEVDGTEDLHESDIDDGSGSGDDDWMVQLGVL